MSFWIQASNPVYLKMHDSSDRSLCDSIQAVFPLESEYAIMVWNCIHIPLSYKYDLSLLVEDVISLCEAILEKANGGEMVIGFPSNTFRVDWQAKWDAGKVQIHSEFGAVIGGTETQLNAAPEIEISKDDFLAEWKLPLEKMFEALIAAGYTTAQIPDLARLECLIRRIPQRGRLYRHGVQ